jgi:hypothetical protein
MPLFRLPLFLLPLPHLHQQLLHPSQLLLFCRLFGQTPVHYLCHLLFPCRPQLDRFLSQLIGRLHLHRFLLQARPIQLHLCLLQQAQIPPFILQALFFLLRPIFLNQLTSQPVARPSLLLQLFLHLLEQLSQTKLHLSCGVPPSQTNFSHSRTFHVTLQAYPHKNETTKLQG